MESLQLRTGDDDATHVRAQVDHLAHLDAAEEGGMADLAALMQGHGRVSIGKEEEQEEG